MLGNNAIFITTDDVTNGYDHRRIDEAFLKQEVNDFNKHFYVCGPDKMIHDINATLMRLGAKPDAVVFEK